MRMNALRLAAIIALLSAGQAQATTFDLNLTGTVSEAQTASFVFNGYQDNQWILSLDGLDSSNAITVSNGDVINATVTLDQPVTIPASITSTTYIFTTTGTTFPVINTESNGTSTFYLGGVAGLSGTSDTSTQTQLSTLATFNPPDNGPLTFDSVTSDFTITGLSQPVTLDSSLIYFNLVGAPVPESQTYAMVLAGLAVATWAAQRRRLATSA